MQPISAYQLPLEHSGAIFPSRLEWLCQPEQIEETLRLLYYLNSWKKASQQLLYADRRGLQEVQALVLARATLMGIMQAVTYTDGTGRFPGELLLESVAENSARGVLIHIQGLRNPDIWPPFYPDGDTIYQRFIRPFYKRITGQDFKLVADAAGALNLAQIRDYIQKHLQKLVERSRATRQPLSLRRLTNLCIAPVDLLHIRDNRIYFLDGYETWRDLDESDLRKLDPEGYSEIALRYTSPTAEYIFHLPFRKAESFVPITRIHELQCTPGFSQAHGLFQGQVLNDEQSMTKPVKEILQDLGVDIASVCPHQLLEKETYLAKPAIRDILWPTRDDDDEDWEDDPWNGICLPPEMAQ